jgi:hypothetical protein
VLRKTHRLIFTATRFLARSVGDDNNFITMPEVTDRENVIEVTMEDLNDEQKKLIEANRDAFTKLCLESFSKITGKVIQKNQLPTLSITVTTTDGSVESFGE